MQRLFQTTLKMLVLVVMLFLVQTSSRAQAARANKSMPSSNLNSTYSASLITCSPGNLVYELYGHTALMIVKQTNKGGELYTDSIVFNYGVFDFTQPNFMWRFMLGKTDYMVQGIPYFMFEEEYVERGSSVVEQRLNLSPDEAATLFAMLVENERPQNRMYRYNFLTCNCTTQVRDKVEACLQGDGKKIDYKDKQQPQKTYRQSLHAFLDESPWAKLGDDLLLGAKTDTVLSASAYRFLPYHLKECYARAVIRDSQGHERPLVKEEVILLKENPQPQPKGFPLSPLLCSLILLVLLVGIAMLEYRKKKIFWVCDLLLMPGIGAMGLLITFMALFSQHPTVGSNWQVWVFNPIPLFCTPWVVMCAIKRRSCLYHYLNAAILALFIVAMPWIPQHFSVITLPLALGLLTRPVSYILNYGNVRLRRSKPRRRK